MTDEVVTALARRYGTRFTTEEIERCVNGAARELMGSVAPESLPEMAIRLAIARLEGRLRSA